MFGELPKLFDRNFAIGYVLPSAVFAALNIWLLQIFRLLPSKWSVELSRLLTEPKQEWIVIYSVATFIVALLLLATSHQITQLLEGYGSCNPFRLISGLERRRFRLLSARKTALIAQRDSFPEDSAEYDRLHARVAEIMQIMVTRFPFARESVLPTAFGNTLRAFESHSLEMYGLDAIPGWHRLLVVLPKDYRELMDSARAQMDFWMNGWFLSSLFLIECGSFLLFRPVENVRSLVIWPVLIAVATIYVFSEMAKQTAVEWGNFVKAAFDMFLPEMLKKLGFKVPMNKAEEEQLWTNFSAALVYGAKEYMPQRDYEALKASKENKPKDV